MVTQRSGRVLDGFRGFDRLKRLYHFNWCVEARFLLIIFHHAGAGGADVGIGPFFIVPNRERLAATNADSGNHPSRSVVRYQWRFKWYLSKVIHSHPEGIPERPSPLCENQFAVASAFSLRLCPPKFS